MVRVERSSNEEDVSVSGGSEHGAGKSAPTLVTATRADRHAVRRIARRDRLAGSLWPIPALFGLGALVAALLSVAVDDSFDLSAGGSRFLVGDTGTALTLTSVVATGMLAFLGIVFATTLVAIQLAASQYSPRAVRVFVRSRLTKISLGIFVATFVYSIVTLIAIRSATGRYAGFTPVLSTAGVAVLVIATLAAFLVFANGTARLLRVQYLVERVADDTRSALSVAFPSRSDSVEVAVPDLTAVPAPIHAPTHGVIDAVDISGLAALASGSSSWIDVVRPIGSYVGTGSVIAHFHGAEDGTSAIAAETENLAGNAFLLSNERSLLLDPGFGLRQLVDIASRALSPAVNDPTTAVQVIDRIVDLLGHIIDRPDPTGWYTDSAGVARVRLPIDSFDELATLGFAEIIRYGADSPQVVRRLRAALDELASRRPRPGIAAMQHLLGAAAEESSPRAFLALGASADPRGLG
jgi:uncharacterized membrane protein